MKNVLLVDDDAICNFLNIKTLERLGLAKDVHTALNGKEALDLFNSYYQGSKTFPDVILLDLNMPVMDGFSFLEAFQMLKLPHKDQVKIVIVSSSDDPADVARAKKLGAQKYLTKPVLESSLRAVLEA